MTVISQRQKMNKEVTVHRNEYAVGFNLAFKITMTNSVYSRFDTSL